MFWLYWQTHWSGCGMYCMWIWHKLLQTLQDSKALQTNKRVKLKCDIFLNDDGEVVAVPSIQQYYYKRMQISFSDFHPRYVSPSRTIARDFKSNKGQSLYKNVDLNSSFLHCCCLYCVRGKDFNNHPNTSSISKQVRESRATLFFFLLPLGCEETISLLITINKG